MVVAIWAPRGLWGLIADRLHIRLFPVGYWLWPAGGPGPAGWRGLRMQRRGLRAGPDSAGGIGGPDATGPGAARPGPGSGGAGRPENSRAGETPGPGGSGE
jgi:hypothetical protein